MGIDLPAEFADIAAATGVTWPEADEDAMRRQAEAWRRAARELGALAGDADAAANRALAAMSGPTADVARRRWSGFVEPDTGRFDTAARAAEQAADRLEHAAEQIGHAKAEIVRHLAAAARNRDAALAAAQAGHPAALAGLETSLRATAANLGAVTDGLVSAVGPGSGPPVSGVGDLVPANPGARTPEGSSRLLAAVTGLPESVVAAGRSGLPEQVAEAVLPEPELPEPELPGPELPGQVPQDAVPPESVLPEPESPDVPSPVPGHIADGDTGPIALTHALTPPTGFAAPGPPVDALPSGFADAPTPPTGSPAVAPPGGPAQTHLAGFAGAPSPVPAPGATVPPAFPAGQPYAPPPMASPHPFGPMAYGAPPPGQVPPASPPAPGHPAAAAPAHPAAPPTVRPPRQAAGPHVPQQPPQQQPPQPPPQSAAASPQHRPPEPLRPDRHDGPVPVGAPRQDRESVIALFLVHMFPIGHLPVASDRPARQLPAPACEDDYAPGLRFPPHDHPRSDLIDPGCALTAVAEGARRPAAPPAEVLPCPPAALFDGYDPLAGESERDWDRRYVVADGPRPEFAWPTAERYPEGGYEPGEPVLLPEGTVLDRFGTAWGRVFAPDGASFANRSLPPAYREAGYRRYRVLRELPVWQAVSAPWFGQPGGAVRYRSVYSAAELVTLGYLADVTFEERA